MAGTGQIGVHLFSPRRKSDKSRTGVASNVISPGTEGQCSGCEKARLRPIAAGNLGGFVWRQELAEGLVEQNYELHSDDLNKIKAKIMAGLCGCYGIGNAEYT